MTVDRSMLSTPHKNTAQEHLWACWAWIIKMVDRDKMPLGLLKMNWMVLAENKKKRTLWWYMTWEFVSKRCLVPLISNTHAPSGRWKKSFSCRTTKKERLKAGYLLPFPSSETRKWVYFFTNSQMKNSQGPETSDKKMLEQGSTAALTPPPCHIASYWAMWVHVCFPLSRCQVPWRNGSSIPSDISTMPTPRMASGDIQWGWFPCWKSHL